MRSHIKDLEVEHQTKKTIGLNFKKELEQFTDSVHSLSENGALSRQEEFLLNMADTIHKLYDSSVRMTEQSQDDLKEVGALIQNIFLKPLKTKKRKQITIIHAIHSFSEQQARESDLSAILSEYTNYPESTKSFIRELELLTEDLDSALEEIA